jgi:hypothetical protein
MQERIESHPSNEISRRASIHGLEKEQRLKGTSPVHLHCPWSLVLISDSFCVQAGETKKYSRMHGAWCVGLIAGGDYVAVGSQRRVAQGEIDNFDACVRLVVGDAILGVLNKGVVFAANKRIEQTPLEILHLLMQHPLCSGNAIRSLDTFFRFSNLRTPKSTLFGWTTTLASSNERSSSRSLKSLLLIRSQYFSRAFCLASSQPQRS